MTLLAISYQIRIGREEENILLSHPFSAFANVVVHEYIMRLTKHICIGIRIRLAIQVIAIFSQLADHFLALVLIQNLFAEVGSSCRKDHHTIRFYTLLQIKLNL